MCSDAAAARARILIVDDHPMIRVGLAQLICGEPDLEVCGECDGPAEALLLIQAEHPDLVIVDISLENSNGLTLILDIKKQHKSQKILVYSMHDESLFALRAVQAGALGYVSKNAHPTHVIGAIRKALGGNLALSEGIAETLLASMVSTGTEMGRDAMALLSNRELEVFDLLGRGATAREIAERLGRSVKTIESHRERIMRKLGLSNSTRLIREAVEWVTERDRIKGQRLP